jgi:SAM-dependent methyltransferase
MLAIELGANLAAAARSNLAAYPHAEVVVAAFEDCPLTEESFDLVIAATSFHWIDPAVRYAKSARVLRPGGALAPFRNEHVATERDGGFFAAVQAVYERVVPAWARAYPGLPRPDEVPDTEAEQIAASGLFGPVMSCRYSWEAEYDTASFVNLLNTYSDHRSLPPATRARLFDGVAEFIDKRYGGRIVKSYLALLYVARRL